ncbi:hypothetical protein QVD17_39612 [Tagetes erecta]|uniref:non-specific serine/threonine protein kinase n=1 Tax=Tagetes erecta TaxID=13708 RepID=A0AAD8JQV4_TARER|nr:hypothetical protein QVD17_39612 [Tagetes erecta]
MWILFYLTYQHPQIKIVLSESLRLSPSSSSLTRASQNQIIDRESSFRVNQDQVTNQIRMDGGRDIGRGLALREAIAQEKNGTLVFKGTYRGRQATVKRFVKGFHDFSNREHRMLLASMEHPNIIRLYGREEDDHFIYLALEPYDCNLHDLVKNNNYPPSHWSSSYGFPSPDMAVLMRGIVAGLAHLHSLGFLHPYLNPSDVLMVGLCPKLSGSCYHLDEDKSLSAHYDADISHSLRISYSNLVGHLVVADDISHTFNEDELYPADDISHAFDEDESYTASISFAHDISDSKIEPDIHSDEDESSPVDDSSFNLDISAPKLKPGMDIFSLASVLYFCLGEGQRRRGKRVLLCDESTDLVTKLSRSLYSSRPKATEVLVHPLFWNAERRLSFLMDVIGWIQTIKSDKLFGDLNKRGHFVFCSVGWHVRVPRALLNEMLCRRSYKYTKLTELLCFVQDIRDHYYTLPPKVQETLKPIPGGIDLFNERFPALLMTVYNFMLIHCKQEAWFERYMDVHFLYG